MNPEGKQRPRNRTCPVCLEKCGGEDGYCMKLIRALAKLGGKL